MCLWVEVQNFGYDHKGISDDWKQRVSASQYDDEQVAIGAICPQTKCEIFFTMPQHFNKSDVAKGDRSPKKNFACVKGPWCCDANVVQQLKRKKILIKPKSIQH